MSIKLFVWIWVCCLWAIGSNLALAQQKIDTARTLNEVVISNYGIHNNLRTTGAETFLDDDQLKNQAQVSLVGIANTVSGVRMEERSPGSYRLSIRGSLLRSPFGIRNVKIYIDDFPLTDAGGNTYLNLIDPAAIASLEIYKGPQASNFGANTGGAVLINTSSFQSNQKEIGLTAGSYGYLYQTAKFVQSFGNYHVSINEGYQESDGYRENSALKRKYLQTTHIWNYAQKGVLKLFLFYSNLHYQTPGGLTETQMEVNLRAARPTTSSIPGAIQQQAGIYNETIYVGLSNNYWLNKHFQIAAAIFGNATDYKNPFITNYEKRKEHTIGLRSYINYEHHDRNDARLDLYLGVESMSTKSDISNFVNVGGNPTTAQSNDLLNARQTFGFFKAAIDFNRKLLLEVGTSLNFFGYSYESIFPIVTSKINRHFNLQLMPKFSASYLITDEISLRTAISKGFSPPTIAEVRASDQIINNELQAELGWNFETSIRYKKLNNRLMIDGALFNFDLTQTIVRRLTATDLEYFVNAGSTKQLGLELEAKYQLLAPKKTRFINEINLASSFTYSHFSFASNHNAMTGVPARTLVNSLEMNFEKGFYIFAQHNYTSSIPLNDANSVFSKSYHLMDLKTGIRNFPIGKVVANLFFGINNLLNVKYSLGNDLNAANGRYYNPAPDRNYYVGIKLGI